MAATIVALCVVGVAGCTSATPSPTSMTVETPPATAAPETASPSPTATPGLGDEMEVGRLDPELTDSIFEFASDGESILFSSGFAEDAGRGASPDLWRYRVHADDPPEVLWRNPDRDHAIVKIAGDLGTVASWTFRGTANAHGSSGSSHGTRTTRSSSTRTPAMRTSRRSSRASASRSRRSSGRPSTAEPPVRCPSCSGRALPDWEPAVLLERDAAEGELWFPSLSGSRVAFCEVVYSADRTTDTRTVYVLELGVPGAEPERLSDSDLATMPILVGDTVIWKEADPGFSMFNWGKLWESEVGGPGPHRLETAPHRVRELSVGRQPIRGVVVRRCLHVRRVRPARGSDARHRALHRRLAGQRPSATHRLGSAGLALRRGRGRRQRCASCATRSCHRFGRRR